MFIGFIELLEFGSGVTGCGVRVTGYALRDAGYAGCAVRVTGYGHLVDSVN